MHLHPKFHHPMFTRLEVIVLTNKQTPLKTSNTLRHAATLDNDVISCSSSGSSGAKHGHRWVFDWATNKCWLTWLCDEAKCFLSRRWSLRMQSGAGEYFRPTAERLSQDYDYEIRQCACVLDTFATAKRGGGLEWTRSSLAMQAPVCCTKYSISPVTVSISSITRSGSAEVWITVLHFFHASKRRTTLHTACIVAKSSFATRSTAVFHDSARKPRLCRLLYYFQL